MRLAQGLRWGTSVGGIRIDPALVGLMGLLFALAVYAALQFTWLKPPSVEGGDQFDYFTTADQLPDVTANHRHVRLGLLLPVRGAIELFGYSEAAYYAVPILSGLALAGFTYVLGRMLFGWAVGVAAALLVTLNPYVLWDSSHLLPDVPAAAALVGAMAALVGAGILHQRGRRDPHTIALLVAGGFLLGWAYLAREYLLIAFPLALVVFFAYRIPWRRLGWVGLGLAPPLILEAAWGTFNYGDPLIRFTTSASPRAGVGEQFGRATLDVIWQLPSLFLARSGGWVFVTFFFGIILYGTYAVIRGDRRFLPLVAWVGGLWLVLVMSSVVPDLLLGRERGFLRLEKFRYWLPVMPGLVIGGVAVVHELIRIALRNGRLARSVTVVSLAVITVLTLNAGISSISHSSAFVRNGADQYLELRDFLRDADAHHSSIYTEPGGGKSLAYVLPMYTLDTFGSPIWHGEIRRFGTATEFLPGDEIDGDLLVVSRIGMRRLVAERGLTPPRYLLHPPPHWEPALIRGGLVVYRSTSAWPSALLHTARPRDWHAFVEGASSRPLDPVVENGRAVFELPAYDSVSVLARPAEPETPAEASREAQIRPGDTVWGRVQMAKEGSGATSIHCYFHGLEGRTSLAASVRSPYTDGLESIDYRCPAPETGGPFRVHVAIEVRGSLELTLGENAVHVTASGEGAGVRRGVGPEPSRAGPTLSSRKQFIVAQARSAIGRTADTGRVSQDTRRGVRALIRLCRRGPEAFYGTRTMLEVVGQGVMDLDRAALSRDDAPEQLNQAALRLADRLRDEAARECA